MKFFRDFLGRAPFVFLGVLGLFSIVGQFMTLEENIHQTLEAWRAVTRPIWDFLLGWLFEWIGFEMPWWVKDYLTMGVVTFGSLFRSQNHLLGRIDLKNIGLLYLSLDRLIRSILAWPLVAIGVLFPSTKLFEINRMYGLKSIKLIIDPSRDKTPPLILRDKNVLQTEGRSVFVETYVYTAIIIAINYAFVLSNYETVEPIISIWV